MAHATRADPVTVKPSWNATRVAAAVALSGFLLALGVAVAFGLARDDGAEATPTARAAPVTTTTKQAPRPATVRVRLTAVGAFDPEGDGSERDDEAPLAVDGRRDTAWRTEHYSTFFKSGVGLVLDMGRPRRVTSVTVDSPTSGASAEIRLGGSPGGPFALVSPAKPLTRSTRFAVAGRAGRYVVVWVVGMPPDSAAEVAEVQVRARR